MNNLSIFIDFDKKSPVTQHFLQCWILKMNSSLMKMIVDTFRVSVNMDEEKRSQCRLDVNMCYSCSCPAC